MKEKCTIWCEIKSNKVEKQIKSNFFRNKVFNILVFYVQLMMLFDNIK